MGFYERLGSWFRRKNTLPLRRRVNAGEVPGPDIHTVLSIFPKGGHPIYLPPEMQLLEAGTPEEATQLSNAPIWAWVSTA